MCHPGKFTPANFICGCKFIRDLVTQGRCVLLPLSYEIPGSSLTRRPGMTPLSYLHLAIIFSRRMDNDRISVVQKCGGLREITQGHDIIFARAHQFDFAGRMPRIIYIHKINRHIRQIEIYVLPCPFDVFREYKYSGFCL